jgi:hypothetical protein
MIPNWDGIVHSAFSVFYFIFFLGGGGIWEEVKYIQLLLGKHKNDQDRKEKKETRRKQERPEKSMVNICLLINKVKLMLFSLLGTATSV